MSRGETGSSRCRVVQQVVEPAYRCLDRRMVPMLLDERIDQGPLISKLLGPDVPTVGASVQVPPTLVGCTEGADSTPRLPTKSDFTGTTRIVGPLVDDA